MRISLSACASICLLLAASLPAHRLDQYLQATMLSVEKNRVQALMRLIPGVAVAPIVLASLDTNADGIISEAEEHAYAEQVLGDVSLSVDGQKLQPTLVSATFPKVEAMKDGLGEIQINFSAGLPSGGQNRRLTFENHHQRKIAAYLVNCLVPQDPDIRIVAQNRDAWQTFYQLDYVQGGGVASLKRVPSLQFWFHGFSSMFRLGMRHIAGGTDHLLFLLTLLLPAPLLVEGTRWGRFVGVHLCLIRSLKIVTAFTIGHSSTLALAALGFIHVPSRPIEVLVAISILISAVHALRPLLPGREAAIAAFLGLIHGLAFASTLGQLGLSRWERIVSLMGFNVGIETMQLIVVAAVIPSLVILGRTRAYSAFRIGGALFAAFASAGWMVERLLGLHSRVDVVVDQIAQHAVWIAALLFVSSLICWWRKAPAALVGAYR